DVDVVKVGPGKYCVLNTAPWVKWQSYLYWLEHRATVVQPPNMQNNNWIEDEHPDPYYQLVDLLDTLAMFLGLSPQTANSFEVFLRGDDEFLQRLHQFMQGHPREDLDRGLLHAELVHNGTCLIPEHRTVYLTNLSVNRAAEKLAQLLNYSYTQMPLI